MNQECWVESGWYHHRVHILQADGAATDAEINVKMMHSGALAATAEAW